ncbi:MAG: hypothetical protein ACLTER_23675 [Ruminococcus sp.]
MTYTTSNKKVCTVTKGGVITAKKKVLQKLRYAPAEKGGYYSQSAVRCKSAKRATPTERKQNIP